MTPTDGPGVIRGSVGGIVGGVSPRSSAIRNTANSAEPTADAMRDARRRWPSGVALVTSVDPADGAFRGATVSAFTVVSLEPPLILVCLDRSSSLVGIVEARRAFAVSILDRVHESYADRFAGYGPRPDGAFTGIAHEIAETGSPVIRGALAWFDCTLAAIHDGGDHLIVTGLVVQLDLGPDATDPLVNYEGAYRRLESA